MRDISNFKGKIFRHFKGDLYLVEDFVKHSETQETMVLYRALYGDCGLFVRPYEMFIEEVPEGMATHSSIPAWRIPRTE